jgi:hypothetical protein
LNSTTCHIRCPMRYPSLRAKRSNPVGAAVLDCFVASLLAMTAM